MAIYTIKVMDEKSNDVVTLNDDKINYLKNIYWDINAVTYEVNIE